MIVAPEPENWGASFGQVYDAWHRLVEVTTGSGPSQLTMALYVYDGLGRRVTKTTFDGDEDYYYSKWWQMLEMRGAEETSQSSSSLDNGIGQFVWGLRSLDDLVQRIQVIEGTVETISYALRDGMHVTSICDSAATIQERYGYNAFGTTLFMNPEFAPQGGSAHFWEVTFCSDWLDPETGLYQVRFRYLHPTLGRWLSRDPIGELAGFNLYEYVGNNPVNNRDFLGLFLIGAVVGFVSGAISGAVGAYGTSGGNLVDAAVGGAIGGILGGALGSLDPTEGAIAGGAAGVIGDLIGQAIGKRNDSCTGINWGEVAGARIGGALGGGIGGVIDEAAVEAGASELGSSVLSQVYSAPFTTFGGYIGDLYGH